MSRKKLLSSRALEVYEFIVRFKQIHDGNSPTVRKIMDGTGITSSSVVRYYLGRLAECGRIDLGTKGMGPYINVVGGEWIPPRNAR